LAVRSRATRSCGDSRLRLACARRTCSVTTWAKVRAGALAGKATALSLTGSQWGVMNETGSYPGQPWRWLYTLWYQVPAAGIAGSYWSWSGLISRMPGNRAKPAS